MKNINPRRNVMEMGSLPHPKKLHGQTKRRSPLKRHWRTRGKASRFPAAARLSPAGGRRIISARSAATRITAAPSTRAALNVETSRSNLHQLCHLSANQSPFSAEIRAKSKRKCPLVDVRRFAALKASIFSAKSRLFWPLARLPPIFL
jgi:hypothetical protein